MRPRNVALAGLVSLAVAMGIGRFAFTPLLPMMLHDGVLRLGYRRIEILSVDGLQALADGA